ncbi:MAG: hypothetical protein QM736_03335 [Vicinamibacterales bacterium]
MLCTQVRFVSMLLATIVASHVVRAAAPRNESLVAHAGPPTFNADIAPLVERRCLSCHRPGQPVPMTLQSMADVRPWLARIRTAIESRRMPPWTADSRFGRFANDPSLSPDELHTFRRWMEAGAPEGTGPVVRLDMDNHTWAHPSGRAPDVVVQLPTAIAVSPSAQWPTFNLYSPLPSDLARTDRFVEAVQLLPGNRRVTHHASLSMRRFPPGVALGRAQPWPGGPLLDRLARSRRSCGARSCTRTCAERGGRLSSGGVAHLHLLLFPVQRRLRPVSDGCRQAPARWRAPRMEPALHADGYSRGRPPHRRLLRCTGTRRRTK